MDIITLNLGSIPAPPRPEVRKREILPWEMGWATAGYIGASHKNLVDLPVPKLALRSSTVYSCLKILVETVSTLPIRVIDRVTKKEVTDIDAARVLAEPNEDQTIVEFIEMLLMNYFAHGNGLYKIERERGRVGRLLPLNAFYTDIRRSRGVTLYDYRPPGETSEPIPIDQIGHLRMWGMDDPKATSPLWAAQRAIILSLTEEQMMLENFADGARPDYVVNLPPEKVLERLNSIDSDSLRQDKVTLQKQIEQARTRRGLYVPFGYAVTPYQANYQQSQVSETRDFQVLDLARIWRVPPSKLGVLTKADSAASTEQQQLGFWQDTLRPPVVKLEKRLEADLMTAAERARYQIKVNVRAMLRGDIAAQTDHFVQLWQIGSITTNEIRELEDRPPFDDPAADTPHWPVNMTTEQIPGANQPTNPADGGVPARKTRTLPAVKLRSLDARKGAADVAKAMFRDAVSRVVKRERSTIAKEANSLLARAVPSLVDRLHELYEKPNSELRAYIEQNLTAPVEALFAAIRQAMEAELGTKFTDADIRRIVRDYVRIWVRDYTHSSLYQILDVIDRAENEADILPAIEARLDEWVEKRADKEAQQETGKGSNILARELYILAGVSALMWVTSGNPCPICDPLDGAIFSANSSFPTPPIHSACVCNLTSA